MIILFSPVWPVKTVTKRIFSKTLSRVEIFKNVGFSITCELTKTGIFKYDNVIHHILLAWRMFKKGCYRFSIVLAFLCRRAKTIRILHVCLCVLFWKRRKKSPCSKISGYVWTRPKIRRRDKSENVKKTIGLISKTTTLHVHHTFCT